MISLLNNNIGEKKQKNIIYIYYNENVSTPNKLDVINVNTNTIMTDVYNGVCQIINLITYINTNTDNTVIDNIIINTTDTKKSPDLYALSNNILYKYNDIITLIKYMYL